RLIGEMGRLSTALAFVSADETVDQQTRGKNARELARKVVQGSTGTFRNYLWLGQVAMHAGQRDEAEKAIRKATQLAPAEPSTWVALISLLAQVDRTRARRELVEAEKALNKVKAS